MGWTLTVVLNLVITACYLGISGLVMRGLVLTGQVRSNPLALATSLIFLSCAAHHGHHAVHVWAASPGGEVRSTFGTWHSVVIDVFGATVAVVYLGMRRRYAALLNTPSMFEDQVVAETERRLRDMAFQDQLTGLANRAALADHADALDAAPGRPLTIGYIDLDGFKPVNDTFGHDTGDRVLREVAGRLKAVLRPDERVYRLGGDEFLVVSPDNPTAAHLHAQRFAGAIAQGIGVRGTERVQLGCSIGLAQGTSGQDLVEDLMRQADAAMYLAKRRGTSIEVFDAANWLTAVVELPGPRHAVDVRDVEQTP